MADRISSKELRKTSRENDDRQAAARSQEERNYRSSSSDPGALASRSNYKTYPYDYFSGADCKVFYGDIWVDDIITIQWNVSQSKTPIYGYSSQLFDAIAKGQLLIQGSLSVSFKEVGYLNMIQATMEAQSRDAGKIIQRKVETVRALADNKLAKFTPRLTQLGDDASAPSFATDYNANGIPSIIRDQETIEDILVYKKTGKKGDMSNASAKVGDQLRLGEKNRDFEDFAELLEDTIWGDSNGAPLHIKNEIKRADEFDYNSFGGITTAKGNDYSNSLNILLTFGDINDYRAEHTMVALNDVHFVSSSMVVSPTGEPIAEMYNFLARDINKSISNEMKATLNPIKLDVGIPDLTLSKLSDVATIEDYINRSTTGKLTITFEAAYDANGWAPFSVTLPAGDFYLNREQPFIDQVIAAVEGIVNSLDPDIAELVKTDNIQYIAKVDGAGTNDAGSSTELVMVLEQSLPNSRTYKVIAPTRSGFGSTTVITRDELFGDLNEMDAPIDVVKSAIELRENEIDRRRNQLAADKANFNDATIEVGREDELSDLSKQKERLESLKAAVPEDDRTNLRKRRLARQENRVKNAQNEYDTAIRKNLNPDTDAGLQDEYRKVVEAEEQAKESDESDDREFSRSQQKLAIANAELNAQRNITVEDRDFSDEEQESFNTRTSQATNLDSRATELREDSEQVEILRQEYNATQAAVKKRDDDIRARTTKQNAVIVSDVQKARADKQKQAEVDAAQRAKEIADVKAEADEKMKQWKIKMGAIKDPNAPKAKKKLTYEVSQQVYNAFIVNTQPTGQAITASALSHKARTGDIYGIKLGDRVAVDIGNLSNGQSVGYILNPFEGKIISKGASGTSFTIQDSRGKKITYAHVESSYVSSLREGNRIGKAERISYQASEAHIHIQTSDYSAKQLERNIWNSGTTQGYRNTIATDDAKLLYYEEKDPDETWLGRLKTYVSPVKVFGRDY